MAGTHFGWLDYAVFVVLWFVSMGIGVYHGVRGDGQSSTVKYFMGNREMSLLPVTVSIVASVLSANTLLGGPAELYLFGINYIFANMSFCIAAIFVAIWIVPLVYPMNAVSVHEYLEVRFKSKSVRLLGTLLLSITQILYVGCVIFGPAIALETATGVPAWGSILLVAVIGTTYTAVGGMKAVIWTDVFQSVVMLGGMLAVIFLGSNRVGGFGKVWNINKEWGRLHMSFNPDPTERMTFWGFLVGNTVYWIGMYGTNQPCVQRFCAMKTEKLGKISMLLNGPGIAVLSTLAVVAGLVVFAYYTQIQCDPLKAGFISNANQLLPYFVMEVMDYPGLPGLFVACLFSGSLSTLSSSINSMSAVIWEDIMKSHFAHLPESRKVLITKILVVFFGLVCMAVSFLVWAIGGNLIQISGSFTGASTGPLLGLYILGGFFPWTNWIGALSGGVIAMAISFWMMLGDTLFNTQSGKLPTPTDGCYVENATDSTWITIDSTTPNITFQSTPSVEEESLSPELRWFYSISFLWYPFSALVITLVIGLVVSFATGPTNPSTVESRLLFTCLKKKYGKEVGSEIEKKPALSVLNQMDEYNTKTRPDENVALKDDFMTDL